jgi:hypothetical protein
LQLYIDVKYKYTYSFRDKQCNLEDEDMKWDIGGYGNYVHIDITDTGVIIGMPESDSCDAAIQSVKVTQPIERQLRN